MTDARHLAHFESLYAASSDPWNVRDAWYEQRKRAILLACLGQPRYRNVFEPGCGNGEMSAALAPRCDRLLAFDGAPSALAAARRRLPESAAPHVRFVAGRLPQDWPQGECFDLIVVSELAYYFDLATLAAMLGAAAASLAPQGELVLCHYRHPFDDRVTPTGAVHDIPSRLPGLRRRLHHLDDNFQLDAWERA